MTPDLAALGPPIPDGRTMLRLPAFRIERWSINEQPNATGRAVLTFCGASSGIEPEHNVVLLIEAHLESGEPKRCTVLRPSDMGHEQLPIAYIPGVVRDLCVTKVLDLFGPRPRSTAWLPPRTP